MRSPGMEPGASTFSDWGLQIQAYDAIYAGALMHRRGCVVSFNSDSPDHARRLNLEAAKAVKYGKLSESEAFKLFHSIPQSSLGLTHGSVHSRWARMPTWQFGQPTLWTTELRAWKLGLTENSSILSHTLARGVREEPRKERH